MNKRCFVSEFEDAAHTNSLICVLADTQKNKRKSCCLFASLNYLKERDIPSLSALIVQERSIGVPSENVAFPSSLKLSPDRKKASSPSDKLCQASTSWLTKSS